MVDGTMNERIEGFDIERQARRRPRQQCYNCVTETGVVRCENCTCPRYEHDANTKLCHCCGTCTFFERQKPPVGWIIPLVGG